MFCENVGFEENYVTYAGYKELIRKYKINSLVETDGIIERQRMIKDKDEISKIQRACEVTDECFKYLQTYIKPGMTEKQIAKEMNVERTTIWRIKNKAQEKIIKNLLGGKNNV